MSRCRCDCCKDLPSPVVTFNIGTWLKGRKSGVRYAVKVTAGNEPVTIEDPDGIFPYYQATVLKPGDVWKGDLDLQTLEW